MTDPTTDGDASRNSRPPEAPPSAVGPNPAVDDGSSAGGNETIANPPATTGGPRDPAVSAADRDVDSAAEDEGTAHGRTREGRPGAGSESAADAGGDAAPGVGVPGVGLPGVGVPGVGLPLAGGREARAALRGALRPYRARAWASGALLLAAAVVGLSVPWLAGRVVDLVLDHGSAATLGRLCLAVAAAAVGQAACNGAGTALVAQVAQSTLAAIRTQVLGRALTAPARQVDDAGTGDLVARATGDVEVVNEAASDVLPPLLEAALTIALTLVALGLLDWRFAVAAALAGPLQALAVRWYARIVVPVARAERAAEGRRAQQLLDSVSGASTVRALGVEAAHQEAVRARSDAARLLAVRLFGLQRRFYGKLNGGELVGMTAVLATGYWLVDDGAASVGAASAAALYFHRLFNQFNTVLAAFDQAQTAGAAFSRMVGVTLLDEGDGGSRAVAATEGAVPVGGAPATGRDVTPQLPAPRGGFAATVTPSPAPGAALAVQVEGLGYAYRPGRPVLHGIDLAVAPGERLAIVGPSGSGKTTLAELIAGRVAPDTGTVRLGGRDCRDLGPRGVRERCVLLSQETHVFAGPLADGLRLARPDATDEEVRQALEHVGAAGWVAALPDGPDTVVGRGGHRLTAARAQELALARLVLADPPIAVLDEATADAGSAGARALERAADRALRGRTAVLVAHRLTQAVDADRIVVLVAGRVAESGTHTQLAAADGPYARLWNAWSRARAGAPTRR
jgi:ATP-binding cassette subfamily C protein